ncbi:MAG: hypothetical protein LUC41_08660 [Clostridiales bacterium]|nr:hypothetical protein [Clostridiales bacterium]
MKKCRKLIGIMLALALCTGLCAATALAADDTDPSYTITIENTTAGQTYSAYKVFDAAYNSTTAAVTYTIDSDSAWYSLISTGSVSYEKEDGSTAALSGSDIFVLTALSTTGEGEAAVTTYKVSLADGIDDTDVITFFRNAELPSGAVAAASGTGNGGELVLDVTENGAGYYFITSGLGAAVTLTTAAPKATVIDKNNEPSVDKSIVNGEGSLVDWDTESMGDEVEFLVDAYVPLYDGDQLVTEYIFTDTMEDGLEIEMDSDIGEGNYTTEKDGNGVTHYYLTKDTIDRWITLLNSDGSYWANEEKSAGGYNTYMGKFSDAAHGISLELTGVGPIEKDGEEVYAATGFILTYYTYNTETYAEGDPDTVDTSDYPATARLYMDYTAHVEEDAEFEEENTIALVWYVTPYDYPAPEDSTPGGNEEDEVEVYETGIQVIKVDENTRDRLSGATFTLSGDDLDEVRLSATYTYTPVTDEDPAGDDDTVYYRLTTGEYTATDPQDVTDPDELAAYEANTDEDGEITGYTQYIRTVTYEYQYVDQENTAVTGTTGEDGLLTFLGLNEGTYTLTETDPPEGYNGLDSSLTIRIEFHEATETDPAYFTATMISADASEDTAAVTLSQGSDGAFIVTVDNNAGAVLPGSGGMGTTIFYIIGGILVVVAVVILITRRRMRKNA